MIQISVANHDHAGMRSAKHERYKIEQYRSQTSDLERRISHHLPSTLASLQYARTPDTPSTAQNSYLSSAFSIISAFNRLISDGREVAQIALDLGADRELIDGYLQLILNVKKIRRWKPDISLIVCHRGSVE